MTNRWMAGPREDRGEARSPSLLAVLAGLLLATGVGGSPGTGLASPSSLSDVVVQEGDTTTRRGGRDTLPDTLSAADTLPAGVDTLPSGRDTSRVDVAGRREDLAGGDFPRRDEFFRQLAALPGHRVIEYRGEQVVLQVRERIIDLRERAQVNYGSDVLRADSIRYLGETQFLQATRGIELVGGGQAEPVTSDSALLYDVSGRRGTIFDARTRFGSRGTEWYVRGDAIPVGRDTLFADPGSFTSCELEEPHYGFRAGQMKTVKEDFIVAWPVVLYVGNVPVMWLPFFAQDIRPGRRSGILPPRFGFNDVVKTSESYDRHVDDFGYYWAINQFMDAEVTMDWFSGNYTRLNGRFRYEFLKKFMSGSAWVNRSWGNTGKSLRLSWEHSQELSPETRLTASVDFVENSNLFRNRSFEPRDQTQSIDSDVAFSHRMDFASLNANARRRQFLGEENRIQMTLPSVSLNFSPVTLFSAPRTRAGAFNNMTWNGSASFSRRTTESDAGPGDERRTGSANTSLRVGSFNLSGRSQFRQELDTPVDSAGELLPETSRTTVDWSSSLDYQLDLVGNTSLRPTADLSGALFRSDSTGGDFVAAPTRASFGADLSTDLYGFFPGFGPFTQLRHRISPQVTWRYAPPVTTDPELAEIPGFPGATGTARNRLSVSLSQTIEAKLEGEDEGRSGAGARDTTRSGDVGARTRPDTATAPAGAEDAPLDTAAAVTDTSADSRSSSAGQAPGGRSGAGSGTDGRKVTLLSLSTSALEFDFERAKEDLPVLVTEQLTANVNSDLLRGLALNMTFDLFEGEEKERSLSPFLTRLGTSFSFRSGTSLGQIFGLGDGGEGRGGVRAPSRFQSTRRPGSSRRRDRGIPPEARGSGPWDLRVRYSLTRGRPQATGSGRESQSLSGTLRLEPTPNWSVWWDTSYNFTSGEFSQHILELERDLHRWRATFRFQKSPNGNFLFDVMVQLTDAPDIKLDYDQRTQTGQ